MYNILKIKQNLFQRYCDKEDRLEFSVYLSLLIKNWMICKYYRQLVKEYWGVRSFCLLITSCKRKMILSLCNRWYSCKFEQVINQNPTALQKLNNRGVIFHEDYWLNEWLPGLLRRIFLILNVEKDFVKDSYLKVNRVWKLYLEKVCIVWSN